MKEYVLSYYPYFKCVAGDCKHTCCADWEMNIDEQTLNAYKNEKSSFGKRLEKGINFKKAQFKADRNGRCAFLNQNGLCEIIINLGEQSLCQVCKDHPRFRSFFNDRIEMGLGFCCEQATKLILSTEDKIRPILISNDGGKEGLDFTQNNVLEFREKALNAVQDRSVDINKRIDNLLALCNAKVERADFAKIFKRFFTLERLDKSWTTRLKTAKGKFFTHTAPSSSAYAEHFLANGLYRYLYDAEDTMWVRARAIALVLGWWLINTVFTQENAGGNGELDLMADVVRAYSAEVEYSQTNLDKLFSFAYKFIKI